MCVSFHNPKIWIFHCCVYKICHVQPVVAVFINPRRACAATVTVVVLCHCVRGGVEGPAGTANAVPLFTVVRIAVPLFKAGRTGAANVPPRMRDCSARAYSTYAWASTVKLILTMAIV